MKKTLIIIVVLIAVGIAADYIFSDKGPSGTPAPTATNNLNTNTPIPTVQSSTIPTPTPTASVSSTPKASVAPKITIDIRNFSFSPATLNIKTGTKVTWVNNDSVSHTVTSDSGNLLNSPTLSPGQSFSFTFTNAGSVNYHCSIHTMMKGSVIVSN
jgi:plastocyanin